MTTMHMLWVLMVMMGCFALLVGATMVAVRVLATRDKRYRTRH